MPVLRKQKLSDAEILEITAVPNSITSLIGVVNDFVDMFKIPDLLLPKTDFNLPLPKADFSKPHISFPITIDSYPDTDNLGFSISTEGRFIYKGVALKHISLNSKHGIFFSKLLNNNENYVSDEEILNELNFEDYRNLGYIKRDMKNALKADGFELKLFRARGKGYKLIAITPISPQ